jgi:branched-chain amino acid aminotransferase
MTHILSGGAAWIRGQIVPISEASLPINDWGLTHSDITYDVAPVRNGLFFRLQDYLTRFENSMAAMRLNPHLSKEEIQKAITDMVAASGLRDSYVAMACSRGVPNVPGSRDPRDCINHFYAWCVPYVHVIKQEILDAGASILIAETVSRVPDASINPRIKNYQWGDFTTGLFEAKEKGFETVVLADQNGLITEGPGFNIFAIKDKRLITSSHGVLAGITRKTVFEIATELGLEIEVRDLPIAELLSADEIFISSSGGGIMQITRVNKTIFSNGKTGPITQQMINIYWSWFSKPEFTTAIDYS